MTKSINITLNVWRQKNAEVKGGFETYHAANISTDMSFLEMIDVVNEPARVDRAADSQSPPRQLAC